MPGRLDSLIDAFLREVWEEFPQSASGLGLTEYADKLGEYSADAFARRNERTDHWLAAFSAVDGDLAADEVIDRDLIAGDLRGDQILRDWAVWRRNPDTYLYPGLSGVFDLFLHRLLPEPDLADAAIARMKQIPAILEDGKRNLDPALASPIFVERSRGVCAAASGYLRDLVPAEVSDAGLRERVAEAGEAAARAYDDMAVFLSELAAAASGPYAIGEDRYSALLREREMLGYGAREMHERGRAEYERLEAEMVARAKDLRGTEDWVEVIRELDRDHPETPAEMQALYAEWTERARAFLVERDLVTFPDGEVCHVVPSPVFQRPIIAVASYSPPPLLTGGRTGHFFVPYPPDGESGRQLAERLESNSRNTIPTVSVHEAYPGHHWHISWMAGNPRVARKVFGSSYFTEGWALYTEGMMLGNGFYEDPRHEMGVMVARIFRAARVVVDTALHLGEMTFDEAVTFMMDSTGFPEAPARSEVGRYCTWPTQAPSYLTGALEIERMRDDWVGRGKTLRSFHDTIAGSGMLPIALAERALNA